MAYRRRAFRWRGGQADQARDSSRAKRQAQQIATQFGREEEQERLRRPQLRPLPSVGAPPTPDALLRRTPTPMPLQMRTQFARQEAEADRQQRQIDAENERQGEANAARYFLDFAARGLRAPGLENMPPDLQAAAEQLIAAKAAPGRPVTSEIRPLTEDESRQLEIQRRQQSYKAPAGFNPALFVNPLEIKPIGEFVAGLPKPARIPAEAIGMNINPVSALTFPVAGSQAAGARLMAGAIAGETAAGEAGYLAEEELGAPRGTSETLRIPGAFAGMGATSLIRPIVESRAGRALIPRSVDLEAAGRAPVLAETLQGRAPEVVSAARRYNPRSAESAVDAASALARDSGQPHYVTPTNRGFSVGAETPPPGTSHYAAQPDGLVELRRPGLGDEADEITVKRQPSAPAPEPTVMTRIKQEAPEIAAKIEQQTAPARTQGEITRQLADEGLLRMGGRGWEIPPGKFKQHQARRAELMDTAPSAAERPDRSRPVHPRPPALREEPAIRDAEPPPTEPTVKRARMTEKGEVVAEDTFATEGELQGYRPEQGALFERPTPARRVPPPPREQVRLPEGEELPPPREAAAVPEKAVPAPRRRGEPRAAAPVIEEPERVAAAYRRADPTGAVVAIDSKPTRTDLDRRVADLTGERTALDSELAAKRGKTGQTARRARIAAIDEELAETNAWRTVDDVLNSGQPTERQITRIEELAGDAARRQVDAEETLSASKARREAVSDRGLTSDAIYRKYGDYDTYMRERERASGGAAKKAGTRAERLQRRTEALAEARTEQAHAGREYQVYKQALDEGRIDPAPEGIPHGKLADEGPEEIPERIPTTEPERQQSHAQLLEQKARRYYSGDARVRWLGGDRYELTTRESQHVSDAGGIERRIESIRAGQRPIRQPSRVPVRREAPGKAATREDLQYSEDPATEVARRNGAFGGGGRRAGGRPGGGGGGDEVPPVAGAHSGGPDDERSSSSLLAAVLEAPPEEELTTTLWRLHDGQIEAEMTEFAARVDDLRDQAAKRGIKLRRRSTPEMQLVMSVLHFDRPTTDLPEAWRPWARQVRDLLDEETARMLAVDPEFQKQLIPDYWPRYWKPRKGTPGAAGTRGKRRLGAKSPYQLKRTLEGSLEGILNAYPDKDLVTWDPLEMLSRRIAQGVQQRANKVQLDRMKALGMALPRSKAPPDWVVPRNAPAFQSRAIPKAAKLEGEDVLNELEAYISEVRAGGRKFTKKELAEITTKEEAGIFYSEPWAVAPDTAAALNNQFDPSAFATNRAGRILRNTVAGLKTLKVLGGLFQHFDYTTRMLGPYGAGNVIVGRFPAAAKAVGATGRAWARGFVPGIDKRLLRYDASNPVRKALLGHGLQATGGRDIMEKQFRELVEDRSFFAGRLQASDSPVLQRAGGAVDYLSSGAYQKAHREYLLSAGEILTENFMRQGDSLGAAAAKAARKVNEDFSSLAAWQSVFKDPTTRDAMRVILFAPNEAESWMRLFFRPFIGPNRAAAVRYWAGMLGTVAIWANMINFLSTGKPLDREAYLPFSIDDDGLGKGKPWLSYNTRFLRPELPWKGPLGRKQYLDLLGQADTPMRYVGAPVFAVKSRLGQLPSAGWQAVAGRRFFGEPIEQTPEGYAKFAGEQALPIPVTGAVGEEISRIGTGGAALQATGFNVMAERLGPLRARERQRLAQEMFEKDWLNLNAAERKQVNTSPKMVEIQQESERIGQTLGGPRSEQLLAERKGDELLGELVEEGTLAGERITFTTQTEDNRLLENGELEPQQWIGRYRDRQDDYYTAKDTIKAILAQAFPEREPTNETDRAIDAYFDVRPDNYLDPTGDPKWDEYFRSRDAAYNRAVRLGGDLVSQYLRPLEDDPVVREFKAAAGTRRGLFEIPKYQTPDGPLSLTASEQIDDFGRAVTKETERLERTESRDYTEREVARYLATQRSKPLLYDWWDALQSEKKRKGLRNPAYDDYLLEHQDELESWFPDYYNIAFMKRTGRIEEEQEGLQPLKPLQPIGSR